MLFFVMRGVAGSVIVIFGATESTLIVTADVPPFPAASRATTLMTKTPSVAGTEIEKLLVTPASSPLT